MASIGTRLNRLTPPGGNVAVMASAPASQPHAQRLSNRMVAFMAVATGAIVANLYYSQPLLHQVSTSFHVGEAATSLVVTCTQGGYALGLLLVVPLGDLRQRRSLTVMAFLAAAVFLVVAALAQTLWLFELASIAIGGASVAGQIMIPFAADMSDPAHQGRTVARIMTGLLVGILLARTVSGLVAEAAGWRTIYWFSAALMVVFAAVLRRTLPGEAPRPQLAYVRLVGSSLRLLASEAALRRRAFDGAAAFGAFSVLWTSLAFLLSGSPFHYSKAVIGLFGLAGVAGVAMANLAGRMADKQRSVTVITLSGLALTGAFGLLALGRTSVVPIVLGIVLLDVGTQGIQITNQAIIYRIRPQARSRINSAYMVCYFTGGAVGSVSAGAVMAGAGWYGVCWLGAGFGALVVVSAVFNRLFPLAQPPPAEMNAQLVTSPSD